MTARNTHASRARRLATMNAPAELLRRLAALTADPAHDPAAAAALRDAIAIQNARSHA